MATETKQAKETVREVKETIETPRIGLFICR